MEKNKKKNGIQPKKVDLKPVKKSGKHPHINTKPVIDKNPADNDPQVVSEALTVARRRKLAQQMIRMARKLVVARKIARAKFAPDKRLKVRAGRLARTVFRKRMAGERGTNYKDLSPSDKVAVDKLLDKQIPRIRKLAKRLFPVVKKAEGLRLQRVVKHRSTVDTSHSPKKHDMGISKSAHKKKLAEEAEIHYLSLALLEGRKENLNKLLKLGLADEDSLNQYIKAMDDPENSVKFSKYREKVLNVLDKLVDLVTMHSGIHTKVQQELLTKKNKTKLKEQKSLQLKSQKSGLDFDLLSEVYSRGLDAWHPGIKHTPQQYAFARVNSFIAGGKAREMDADLLDEAKRPVPMSQKPSNVLGRLAKRNDAVGAAAKAELRKRQRANVKFKNKTQAVKAVVSGKIDNATTAKKVINTIAKGKKGSRVLKKVLKQKIELDSQKKTEAAKTLKTAKDSYKSMASSFTASNMEAVKKYLEQKAAKDAARKEEIWAKAHKKLKERLALERQVYDLKKELQKARETRGNDVVAATPQTSEVGKVHPHNRPKTRLTTLLQILRKHKE